MSGQRIIKNLALIGFMGSGKSSVGRLAAAQLDFQFVDTDDLIEARAGKPISDIFSQDGEEAFRNLERQIVSDLSQYDHTVISTGGGLGANPENLASLKEHALVVCLWASPDTVWQRVGRQTHRPLLQTADPECKIQQLLAERAPIYRQADVLVSTEARSMKEVAHHLLHEFKAARSANS